TSRSRWRASCSRSWRIDALREPARQDVDVRVPEHREVVAGDVADGQAPPGELGPNGDRVAMVRRTDARLEEGDGARVGSRPVGLEGPGGELLDVRHDEGELPALGRFARGLAAGRVKPRLDQRPHRVAPCDEDPWPEDEGRAVQLAEELEP